MKMRYLILILCLVPFQVRASDWLNRTIRVDLIADRFNHRAFDPKYDILERSERISSGVNATNGQYPWNILTTAWSNQGSGFRIGTTCSGTIISNNFVLSDLHCVGLDFNPPASSIEVYYGSVQWSSPRTSTNFVRHFWYIEPSSANRPNIVLMRINDTITYSPNVHPIQLPFFEDFAYEGWSSSILGYRTPDGPFTAQLQSAHVSIFNNNLCNFYGSIDEHEICGIDGSEPYESGSIRRYDAFTGGAWIVYEYTYGGLEFSPIIVGIHQYQYANQTASYGRATRVTHFVQWIQTLSEESSNATLNSI